jgi:hypothetical protein
MAAKKTKKKTDNIPSYPLRKKTDPPILFPTEPTSIDPKIIEAAVKKVIAERRAKK